MEKIYEAWTLLRIGVFSVKHASVSNTTPTITQTYVIFLNYYLCQCAVSMIYRGKLISIM